MRNEFFALASSADVLYIKTNFFKLLAEKLIVFEEGIKQLVDNSGNKNQYFRQNSLLKLPAFSSNNLNELMFQISFEMFGKFNAIKNEYNFRTELILHKLLVKILRDFEESEKFEERTKNNQTNRKIIIRLECSDVDFHKG